MLNALKCVHSAFVPSGRGMLDFERELRSLKPDVFVVNEDGHGVDKMKLCAELNIEYRLLQREPHSGLPRRSTTELRVVRGVPYRIDLAGGWLDQPFVSKHRKGAVVTVCIEPTNEFDERSGLATSTRRVALQLWDRLVPTHDYETIARVLFAVENPPGKDTIAGSQDAIGIAFPGFTKSDYSGEYWPDRILHRRDVHVSDFVNDHIRLVPLGPRRGDLDVLSESSIDTARVSSLADAADRCWDALLDCDVLRFGAAVRASFQAQIAMFPRMVNRCIMNALHEYKESSYGWKLCGAGGGGYIMLVTDGDIKGGLPITVRR